MIPASGHRHEFDRRAVDSLVPYARNSRTHSPAQVKQIAKSIEEFGFTSPVLIDEAGMIVAGHGRVVAAKRLGIATVPVVVLKGLTEAQKRAYVIADNKIALNSGWDEALLKAELQDLSLAGIDLGILGFDDSELTGIVSAEAATRNPDLAPPAPAKPRSRCGDIWILGAHRVACGDSTDAGTIEQLMDGRLGDACWTDPPYNVAYVGKAGKIKNDSLSQGKFEQLLRGSFQQMSAALKPGAAAYVAHSEAEGVTFRRAFQEAGFHLSACLIWRKNSLVIGRSDYQYIHEPILYGWKEGAAHRWYGGRKQTTIAERESGLPFVDIGGGKFQLEIGEHVFVVDGAAKIEEVLPTIEFYDRPTRSDLHPTMKPVALVERQLSNNARRGDLVLDLFGGSGTTLIAAERLGMAARICELDPKFADVIVERWQEFTGERALRAADGVTFDKASRCE